MVTENALTVEDTLRTLVAKITHKKNIVLMPGCTFKELGVDSLDTVHIMVALEDIFDIDLVDEDMKSITNIGAFTEYIKRKIQEKR